MENIVGKGENAGNQHFLLFPTMFSKGLFSWSEKLSTVRKWVEGPRQGHKDCNNNTMLRYLTNFEIPFKASTFYRRRFRCYGKPY